MRFQEEKWPFKESGLDAEDGVTPRGAARASLPVKHPGGPVSPLLRKPPLVS